MIWQKPRNLLFRKANAPFKINIKNINIKKENLTFLIFFSDISSTNWSILRSLYLTPYDIDLFIGGIAEDVLPCKDLDF